MARYVVISPLKHDGVDYHPGAQLALGAASAAPLLALGVVVAPPPPAAPVRAARSAPPPADAQQEPDAS